jgi:predicted enzyme related to lactoylglutathione lyase
MPLIGLWMAASRILGGAAWGRSSRAARGRPGLQARRGDAPPILSPAPTWYWEDVDAAWQRAVAAGAEVIYPLEDQFYGERGGRLRDPSGQQWMMSQHIEDVPAEEMARRAAAFFSR